MKSSPQLPAHVYGCFATTAYPPSGPVMTRSTSLEPRWQLHGQVLGGPEELGSEMPHSESLFPVHVTNEPTNSPYNFILCQQAGWLCGRCDCTYLRGEVRASMEDRPTGFSPSQRQVKSTRVLKYRLAQALRS